MPSLNDLPQDPRFILFACTAGGVLALAMLLTLMPRWGPAARAVSGACTRAPMLDVLLSLFTWIPWAVAIAVAGWRGFVAAFAGQVVAMLLWIAFHELTNLRHVRGPRIVRFLNRTVGRVRNHTALWVTIVALPAFLIVRFFELALYPLLVWMLRFPRHRQGEWVNVSRQKFEGLVGHDLIWCLYCDWMTGVYALGGEMLRNVESFWCPIRFYDGKKCENCRIDVPDVDGGWVPADKSMSDVVATMERMYGGAGDRSWFGHPARLTVEGRPVAAQDGSRAPRSTT
ncbi:MAG: hypothetical protein U0575_04090 [Phycisphaerales bacterium]